MCIRDSGGGGSSSSSSSSSNGSSKNIWSSNKALKGRHVKQCLVQYLRKQSVDIFIRTI